MSSISLKAFVTFKRERVNLPSIRYGASDCIERPGYPRKLIFHIASVPLPGIDKPTLNHGVLALLYGTHDLQEEMRRRRVEARHLSEEIHSADVIVEVGDIKVSHINHDDLKNLRFANIRRMTSSLQSVILQRIEQLHGGFKTETSR